MPSIPRLPKMILDELGDVPYELKPGRKHVHLYVGGFFTGVFSRCTTAFNETNRDTLAMRANIRRVIRERGLRG